MRHVETEMVCTPMLDLDGQGRRGASRHALRQAGIAWSHIPLVSAIAIACNSMFLQML